MTRIAATPPRGRLSMTPLIDVIFLLLMFFMLASTFARQVEFELALAGGGAALGPMRPLFVQLGPESLALNGTPVDWADLPAALTATAEGPGAPVLVALGAGVDAQRLVDALRALRASGHPVRVLR